jgi:hypothetical protein
MLFCQSDEIMSLTYIYNQKDESIRKTKIEFGEEDHSKTMI